MNESGFVAKFREYEEITPALSHTTGKRVQQLIEGMMEDAKPEHALKVDEVGYMVDQAFCKCGWESNKYMDGREYARGEWQKHVFAHIHESIVL